MDDQHPTHIHRFILNVYIPATRWRRPVRWWGASAWWTTPSPTPRMPFQHRLDFYLQFVAFHNLTPTLSADHHPTEAGRKKFWHLRHHGLLHNTSKSFISEIQCPCTNFFPYVGGKQRLVCSNGCNNGGDCKPWGWDPARSQPAGADQAKVLASQWRVCPHRPWHRVPALHLQVVRPHLSLWDHLSGKDLNHHWKHSVLLIWNIFAGCAGHFQEGDGGRFRFQQSKMIILQFISLYFIYLFHFQVKHTLEDQE